MGKNLRITGLVLIILLFSLNIDAQKEWNLEECISYALENNIQIKRQGIQADIAKNNFDQSKIDLLPNLNGSGNHSIGSGPNQTNYTVGKQTFSNGQLNLTSDVTLFSGFQKVNTINKNKYDYMSSVQNLEKAKNDISLNIASAYLQILFNNELLEIAKNQLSLSQMQVEKTKKLVDVGNVARGSLLEIQAQAAAEEANVTSAQNQLNLSYISLAQILDLDTLKNFKIRFPGELSVPASFNEDPDSIYRIAFSFLPQIKSFDYQLKSSQAQLAFARGYRYPQISLNGKIGSNYALETKDVQSVPAVNDQLNNNLYKQVTLTLSIPIFNKFQVQNGINNAKLGVKDNEYALRQAQLSLRKEVEQAYADATASFENYKSRLESVTASEESFKYVQQKFDVGLVNSVDYNISKNNYTKAKSDLLQAKYEFIFKTKILDFYKGNMIRL